MKQILLSILLSVAVVTANAGQVITLTENQTLPLANGDVVACLGSSSAAPVIAPPPPPPQEVTCTLLISGLPPFEATASTARDAQRFATLKCERHAASMNFSDPNLQNGKICHSGTGFYLGFSCK